MRLRTCLLILVMSIAVHSRAESRWAFVVGIDDYSNLDRLDYAASDAGKVARALGDSGFRVAPDYNPSLAALKQKWEKFLAQINPGDVALVYFAGHGIQKDGVNYILPRDFGGISAPLDTAIRIDEWIVALSRRQPSLKIVILDACRNNPLKGEKPGLAGMENPSFGSGTYIMYSASPGRVAKDQVFAKNLVRQMATPGALLPQVFSNTAVAVRQETAQSQAPFAIDSGGIPPFYFSKPDRVAPLSLAAEGQCEKAIPLLETLLSVNPNDGSVLLALGGCVKDSRLARANLDRARQLLDRPHEIDTKLAEIAYREKETYEAKDLVDSALREVPDYPPALLLQGKLLMDRGEYSKAIDIFERLFQRTGSKASCELFAEALLRDGAPDAARVRAGSCAAIPSGK